MSRTKHGQHLRALVVDDDQPIRFMLRKILEREGFDVDGARDGSEAIELMKKTDYEVVFLDLMLPQMDGYEVLDFVRNQRPSMLKDVVVMTAGSIDRVRDHAGAVLTKPFDLEEISAQARRRASRRDWAVEAS